MNGRVVALVGRESMQIEEYELPVVPEGAALLRVRRANVCGSDVHIYHWRNPNLRDLVMGHEFVAEIAELGEGLTTDSSGAPVSVGDRVVVVYFRTCHKCTPCNRGDFNMCVNGVGSLAQPARVAPHFHGAFATHYYLTPGQYFYKVPDGLSDAEVAGANCGLAQVMFALDGLEVKRAQTVVVQGAGGLGLYACAVANSTGARVIVVERDPKRIEAARAFGAAEVVDMIAHPTPEDRLKQVMDMTDGEGADAVLEVTGRSEAFAEAIGFARIGGSIASVGNLNMGEAFELKIAPAIFTRKNLRVHGYLRYDPWYLLKAVNFIADNQDRYPFESLSDRTYSLDEIEEALAKSESGEVARPSVIPS
jgi:threonine dehydrogenase-like Zn-dependent dehydrogenase